MKNSNNLNISNILALTALVAGCATSNQSQKGYQEAKMRIINQGVSIDDTIVCNERDPLFRSNLSDFSDLNAKDARLNKYFRDKGESLTDSFQGDGKHYVLTTQGNVYLIGNMRIISGMSENGGISCAQAYDPITIKKTKMTASEYNQMTERSRKKWDDERKRDQEEWDTKIEEDDRRWKEMLKRDNEFFNDLGNSDNFDSNFKGEQCVTATKRGLDGKFTTTKNCQTRR